MKRLGVLIDGSEDDRVLLKTATLFAACTSSQLDVLFCRAAIESTSTHLGKMASVLEDSFGEDNRVAAKYVFNEICSGVQNTHWFEIERALDEAIRIFGLLYDLIIVGRLSVEQGPAVLAFNAALFETGSPVLVSPAALPETVGDVVAVVWTGTIQSARTLRSALPVLRAAKQTYLLTNTANSFAEPGPVLDYLRLYDVGPDPLPFDGSKLTARGRGRAIIEAARSISADLIVTGAFGDNKFDVLFGLGRTTRKLVTAAPVPLFLQS